ncbi:MAG TPA: hypothetical protein DET40_17560 [Lentisphaeria bacterium]|nr:MAG: hypothetical protein A2X45_02445 [Lentisphaerae bacterium GWF2_50_93]HCE45350.1 hypothetical protein [Lentisphaeria bacterium]
MRTVKVRHFGIVVKDMEKSLRFYRDMLGLDIFSDNVEQGDFIDRILGLRKIEVRTIKMGVSKDATLVELLEFRSHKGEGTSRSQIYDIGPRHIAIEVEDVDSAYSSLVEKGISFLSTPETSPEGKAKVAFCQDPDGTPVELVQIIIR